MRNKNFDNGGLCTGRDYCKDKEPLLSRKGLDYELNRLDVICELKRGINKKNDEKKIKCSCEKIIKKNVTGVYNND